MSWAMTEKSSSQRRACALVGIAPKTFRYASTRPDDGELRDRLKALADDRRRFGYRRLHILLKREGVELNHKKLFRLYRKERLTLRRRGGRKRALGTHAPMAIPQGPNQRWSTDFVQDVLADGRRFRIWALVDDFSRECLALVADTSISGRRVARELDQVIERRGRPCMIVRDNGTEFTSNAMLTWVSDMGIERRLIAPGKPMRDTASPRASTAGSGTSASTNISSAARRMRGGSSKSGGPTTTTPALTPASAASRRGSSQPGPWRTRPRTTLTYERGHSGGRVTIPRSASKSSTSR